MPDFSRAQPDDEDVVDPTALALREGIKTWNRLVEQPSMTELRRLIFVELTEEDVRRALLASVTSRAQESTSPDDYSAWSSS